MQYVFSRYENDLVTIIKHTEGDLKTIRATNNCPRNGEQIKLVEDWIAQLTRLKRRFS